MYRKKRNSGACQLCCLPLIPAHRRWRQEDPCKFKSSLVYKASPRAAKATQRNPVWGWGWGMKFTQLSNTCWRNCLPLCLVQSSTLMAVLMTLSETEGLWPGSGWTTGGICLSETSFNLPQWLTNCLGQRVFSCLSVLTSSICSKTPPCCLVQNPFLLL